MEPVEIRKDRLIIIIVLPDGGAFEAGLRSLPKIKELGETVNVIPELGEIFYRKRRRR